MQRLVDFFRARGTEDVSEFEVVQEDVRFMLPQGDPAGAGGTGVNCTPCRRRPGDSASTVPVDLVEAGSTPPPESTANAAPPRKAKRRRRAGVGRLDPVLAVAQSRTSSSRSRSAGRAMSAVCGSSSTPGSSSGRSGSSGSRASPTHSWIASSVSRYSPSP